MDKQRTDTYFSFFCQIKKVKLIQPVQVETGMHLHIRFQFRFFETNCYAKDTNFHCISALFFKSHPISLLVLQLFRLLLYS
jgi:hypothetical protein